MSAFLSEVVADDTPAVQAVLKADTRRLKLLEEERQLQVRLEKGEDSVAERLDKVRAELGGGSGIKVYLNEHIQLQEQESKMIPEQQTHG